MKQTKEAKIQEYLKTKVSVIFERMMVELLAAQPDGVVDWSIHWLNTKGRDFERKRIVSASPIVGKHVVYDEPSDEDEDDEVEELPVAMLQKMKPGGNGRISVSAEVYGVFNKKEDFKARVIQKSQNSKDRIIKRLMQSFMFQALDDKERDIVVNAMEEKKYQAGDWIIRQGEDGDNLYVVDEGELDCYKKFSKLEDEKFLKTYIPGESFGELALLYNAPRAASIKAKNQAVLFALDRATFNNIVKDAAVRKREKYENVLQHIDLLSSMDPYERTHVCDGIKEQKYKAGDYVINEGDPGDKFYMIEEGELIATKTMQQGQEPIQVYAYKAGDYFGELALIRNVPRQANVIAKTEVTLVYLDQSAFRRLLGPIEEILQRNSDRYQKYLKQNI